MCTYHKQYVSALSEYLKRWLRRKSRPLPEETRDAALTLININLDPIRGILSSLYAPSPRGSKPYDPVAIFRALLLMVILKVESIPKFAMMLKRSPRLAVIAGFSPYKTPVAGTFYLFIDRFEDGPYLRRSLRRGDVKLSSLRKGKHLRSIKEEKKQRNQDHSELDSVTRALGQKLSDNDEQPRPDDMLKRLEDILFSVGVIPSALRGLLGKPLLEKPLLGENLGDTDELDIAVDIAGDGSPIESSANCNGQPSCDCRNQGIYRCDCPRYYSDPTADWGFDSYRNRYYFGHTYYQHLVSSSGHDLPIHVGIGPASETDFTLSMKSLDRLRKTIRENGLSWKIKHVIYDSGHDATGIYEYLDRCQISPIIALNPRRGSHPAVSGNAERVNEEGIPICKGGSLMRRHGCDKRKHRIIYHCPIKRQTHKGEWKVHLDECPLGVLCQTQTKMGPVVYVKTTDDPRLYPQIARSSSTYRNLMKLRSGCERSNSTKKVTHKLENRPCRNETHYLFRLYLISIIEHAKAWLAEDRKQYDDEMKLVESMRMKYLPEVPEAA